MENNWNRRQMLQSLSLGVIAGHQFLAATARASVAASPARCSVYNYQGEPLPVKEFDRFHTCDLLMRPFTIAPEFEPGMAAFQPPERPFRISLPLSVPGFGQVFVYADNRGRGYSAKSFSEKPLMLNYEFAADRLATVLALLEECRHSGIAISPAARGRADKSEALLKKSDGLLQDHPTYIATLMSSLCESLWAGEMIAVERAEQRIVKNGLRSGFLFGCQAFGYGRRGGRRGQTAEDAEKSAERSKKYIERFDAAFNFATLPFYRGGVERELGKPNYSGAENVLDALGQKDIITKGHPLIFLVPAATPDWLRNLSYEETKKHCLEHVRRTISRFRSRIHIWDVINEAHVQPDVDPGSDVMKWFTKDENVDLTVSALKAARETDPTCFRVVNSTGTWCDYYMGRQPQPWQQNVYDYLQKLKDVGAEYEAVGLQYYHSGRDLLEFERNLESFQGFGKPVHITELGISSSPEAKKDAEWWGGGVGGAKFVWHGERFAEENQAQWVEWLYKIAFSKTYVDALTWWDFTDPGFIPNGGFLRSDCTPKPSYDRLLAMQAKWREEGILPPANKPAADA